MTETRRDRLAGDGEFDGAAEAASLMSLAHGLSFARMRIAIARTCVLKVDRAGQVLAV
jgi:hypothetical protein